MLQVEIDIHQFFAGYGRGLSFNLAVFQLGEWPEMLQLKDFQMV
jgi:hypothetical protein